MDPEKTLTFCLGVKAEEMTMSLQGLYRTEVATVAAPQTEVAAPQTEVDLRTVNKVVKHHGGFGSQPVVSPKYCPGVNNNPGYLCETGHCCGETGCCTYYYELWWFWLLWTVLILFSFFCAYRHRRAKLRIQQQQRQREINLIAYNGACNYPSSMLDLSFLASFKLPSYEEVAAQPSTPPPPYSSVFALQGGAIVGPSSSYPHHHHHRHPCPPYLGPGPSGLTSSQSSDNYTSCSCESCSLTSPCSTSFSVQVTDETYDSSRMSTPSDACEDCAALPRLGVARAPTPSALPPLQVQPDVIPTAPPDVIPKQSSRGFERVSPSAPALSLPLHSLNTSCAPHHPRLPLSPLVLLSPFPTGQPRPLAFCDPLGVMAQKEKEEREASFFAPTQRPAAPPPKKASLPLSVSMHCNYGEEQREERREEDEDEEEDEEDHFRHRRLTGDSGIEVCRCHVKREEQEEEELQKGRLKGRERLDALHDSADCTVRAKGAVLSPLQDDCAEQQHGHGISSSTNAKTGEAIITVESS